MYIIKESKLLRKEKPRQIIKIEKEEVVHEKPDYEGYMRNMLKEQREFAVPLSCENMELVNSVNKGPLGGYSYAHMLKTNPFPKNVTNNTFFRKIDSSKF
jgi:hypothetical protein